MKWKCDFLGWKSRVSKRFNTAQMMVVKVVQDHGFRFFVESPAFIVTSKEFYKFRYPHYRYGIIPDIYLALPVDLRIEIDSEEFHKDKEKDQFLDDLLLKQHKIKTIRVWDYEIHRNGKLKASAEQLILDRIKEAGKVL